MISQSQKNRTLFYVLLIPVLMLTVGLVSCQSQPGITAHTPAINEKNPDAVAPVPLNLLEVRKAVAYPKEAQDKGQAGTVVARILVDEKGDSKDFKLVKKAGDILNQAVSDHILDLKFEPATVGGKPVQFWVNIPFNFKLLP